MIQAATEDKFNDNCGFEEYIKVLPDSVTLQLMVVELLSAKIKSIRITHVIRVIMI